MILYDGECPFCVSSVERLRQLDDEGRLEFANSRDPEALARAPGVSADAVEKRLHAVPIDGSSPRAGYDAIRWLAERLPSMRRFRFLFRIPGATPIGRKLYDFVARHRRRLRGR